VLALRSIWLIKLQYSEAIGPDNWGVFEEEVDDVQPISIRRRLADTEPCN
jgi:hypothetical protein